MTGYIDSIETMGLVDGPGIRMIVFMSGCKMRCLFCHNPESWDKTNATEITEEEIITKLKKNINYYNNGGITFSGGEPLMQPEFLINTLKMCKENGIHTAIDTSGVGIGRYEEILDYTDLVLLDIKHIEEIEYKKLTGQSMNEFNKFITILKNKKIPIWIRQVVIPTINDNFEYMEKLKNYIDQFNYEKVELLPYHSHAVSKYEKLKIPYYLENIKDLSMNDIKKFQTMFD